jgi:hypothetical protein
MAYPSIDAPYGLIPINLIGGQVFAGSTRQIPIASAYDTSIFYGDVVTLTGATGTIVKDVGTTTATPVGVFLGCSFTDPVFGKTFRQYYPANTVATDIVAYVLDDPDALFKVAVVSSGTTIGFVTRAAVGENSALVQNAGLTTNGNSRVAISASSATTNTLPVRIIDVVPETAQAANPGNFTEVIVKWNFGMHLYERALGV